MTNAPQDVEWELRDRPANRGGAEVTPEMEAAGARAIHDTFDTSHYCACGTAVRVFKAMMAAAPKAGWSSAPFEP